MEYHRIRIVYPVPLSEPQEDILISYFQSHLGKMKESLRFGARALRMGGKSTHGQIYEEAQKELYNYLRLEKPSSTEYQYLANKQVFTSVDMAHGLPKAFRKLIYGNEEGSLFERVRKRIDFDIRHTVARRMGCVAPEIYCDIVELESGS